jgi:Flp pilus assembly protein TadG
MSPHPYRIRKLSPLLGRFCRDRRGVAALEFALILPILVLLTLGCFEVPRYVLLWQRLERASSGVSDLVAQADEPMTDQQMVDIFSAGKIMMQPYDIIKNGSIVVTSINNPTGGNLQVTWRRACGTGNNVGNMGNSVGPNATPTVGGIGLPTELSPTKDNEVLVTEVYFTYTPIFKSFIYQGSTLYAAAYTRPRNHNLMSSPIITVAQAPRCPS